MPLVGISGHRQQAAAIAVIARDRRHLHPKMRNARRMFGDPGHRRDRKAKSDVALVVESEG